MRFRDSANSFPISDGPHRIEQTASTPEQVLLAVPAIDVAKTIVVNARPLTPALPGGGRIAEPEQPAVLPAPEIAPDLP